MKTQLKILEPEFVYSEHYYRVNIEYCDVQYQWGVHVYNNPKLGYNCISEMYRIDRNPLKNSVKKKMKKIIQELFNN